MSENTKLLHKYSHSYLTSIKVNAILPFTNVFFSQVVCDERGSKGYGFVHFETQEAANRAIDTMNGMLLNDRKV